MEKTAIIIGAGMGGLTCALALRRAGFEVQVFERAAELKPVGAGIWMAPNAMAVFAALGIARDVQRSGITLDQTNVCDADFRPIQSINLRSLSERFGYGMTSIHRGRLQQILAGGVPPDCLHFGRELVSIQDGENGVRAIFGDGSTVAGDFLIGADGIRSVVRAAILGSRPLRYSGQTCWRGVAATALEDRFLRQSFEIWGPRIRFGFAAISASEVYWFAVKKSPVGLIDDRSLLKGKLAAECNSLNPLIPRLIETTESADIIRSDLFDLPPFRPWSRGKICLIGDAAHPMTPNLGQGGAQAVEDAYFIGESLGEFSRPEAAFVAFENRRFRKVSQLVLLSHRFGRLAQLERLSWLRNSILRLVPQTVNQRMSARLFGAPPS